MVGESANELVHYLYTFEVVHLRRSVISLRLLILLSTFNIQN